jgi:hypothetical protein
MISSDSSAINSEPIGTPNGEGIHNEILVLLCDYRCKGEETYDPAVTIRTEFVSDKTD